MLFVVHKHQATSLHYDLRLEIGGVMPSWSVPKGPTLDSSVKRLALPTTDHDLEYRKFEGVIPAGRPGAGPVMIWDQGTYDPEVEIRKGVREPVTEKSKAGAVALSGLREGNLKFFVFGRKLGGSFALVRTSGIGGKETWLLIKHRDAYSLPGYVASNYDYSAASNRSLSQIAADAL